MSKWFNVRFKGALCALGLLAAVGACGGKDEQVGPPSSRPSTVVEPEPFGVDQVPQEEPGVVRSQWRASNDAARTVAGNLRVSLEGPRGGPVVFAFANGVTIRAQPINAVIADAQSGSDGQMFAALIGGDQRVSAHIYRVLYDNVTRAATRGGLCGSEDTTHLAVSEYVDDEVGNWVFKVGAFKGENAPGSPGIDPEFCDAYAYIAP